MPSASIAASIVIGQSCFIRPLLFRKWPRALPGSPVRHRAMRLQRRADRPRSRRQPARNPRRLRQTRTPPRAKRQSRRRAVRTIRPTSQAARRSRRSRGARLRHRARRTTHSRRRASPAAIESWRVASPPHPAMRSGFSDGSASSSAASEVRCAPSAPARATSSTWPSSSRAAPAFWISGASALMRAIMLFWSTVFSRSSTAATSAAASKPGNCASSCDGSSSSDVAR